MIVEKLGHDKVKQRPELSHRVLNRSTGQEQSVSGIELKKDLPATTRVVLDSLSLIEDHVIPFDLEKLSLVLRVVRDQIVRRDQHVNLHRRVSQILWVKELAEFLALLCTAPVWQNLQGWTEFLQFILPIVKSGHRNNNQEGTPGAF